MAPEGGFSATRTTAQKEAVLEAFHNPRLEKQKLSEPFQVVEPKLYLVGRQQINEEALDAFLKDEGVENWSTDTEQAGEKLVEVAGRLCFDDQTEILTEDGWKRFDCLSQNDQVATLNPTNYELQFQPILAFHSYDYDGDLLDFGNREISFSVTPEHRQFAAKSTKKGRGERRFYETKELLQSRSFDVLTAPKIWFGVVPEKIEIETAKYRQNVSNHVQKDIAVSVRQSTSVTVNGASQVISLARLMAHYVPNGSISKQRGSGAGLVIYGREFAEVQKLCEKLQLGTSVWIDPRNGCPRVSISGGLTIAEFFEKSCGRGSINKQFPKWVLNLPSQELEEIWQILVKTDGHTYGSGRQIFLTGSRVVADQVQELLGKIGASSYQTTVRGTSRDCFVVSRKIGRPAVVLSSKVKSRKYNGKVYCVTTRNGVVYVRRNGKVHFSGNCYMSFAKPRPGGHQAYVENIINQKHGSVLEHSVFNFILTGVDRALSHELVRHRAGFGYSQLSQRFVDQAGDKPTKVVMPDLIREITKQFQDEPHNELLGQIFEVWTNSIRQSIEAYQQIDELLQEYIQKTKPWLDKKSQRKKTKEAARSVLPNATETKIFITSNVRAIRNLIERRGDKSADALFQRVAVALLLIMQTEAPEMFADYRITENGIETEHEKV